MYLFMALQEYTGSIGEGEKTQTWFAQKTSKLTN